MQADEKLLKIISNETIGAVNGINIVTPSIYKSYFEKNASSHGASIPDEEKLTDTLLDSKIQMCESFQERNSQNVIRLSDNTSRAIHAIKEKNDTLLGQVLEETNQLKQEIEQLKEAVYKDELTNVFNRKWMNDHYLDENNENFTEAGTLAIIDLNYFKIVNDTFGHVIGDKVLMYIASQLKHTREHVVRYGGDEFMVFFPAKITKELAVSKLNKIRDNVTSKKLKAAEHSFRVSFSIGVHEFKTGEVLTDIIELADKDMYADKVEIKKKITGID